MTVRCLVCGLTPKTPQMPDPEDSFTDWLNAAKKRYAALINNTCEHCEQTSADARRKARQRGLSTDHVIIDEAQQFARDAELLGSPSKYITIVQTDGDKP